MWVIHVPGKCENETQSFTKTTGNANENYSGTLNKQALTSIFKKKGNLSSDEIESKVEAILAVMES